MATFATVLFDKLDKLNSEVASNKFVLTTPAKNGTMRFDGNVLKAKANGSAFDVSVSGLKYRLGGVDGSIFSIGEEVIKFKLTIEASKISKDEGATAATTQPYIELTFGDTLIAGTVDGVLIDGNDVYNIAGAAFSELTKSETFDRYSALFVSSEGLANPGGKYSVKLNEFIDADAEGFLRTGVVYTGVSFEQAPAPTPAPGP